MLWFVRQTRRHIANVYAASESVRKNRGGGGVEGKAVEAEQEGGRGEQTEFYVAS